MNLGAAQAGRQRAGVNRYSTGPVSDLQAASTYLWQAKIESVLAPGLAKSYSAALHFLLDAFIQLATNASCQD
jgi:hypothetical protein